jgi:hypothetical protein
MASSPAVSVVLPVRNGAAFIAAALDSILAQTWSDLEVVVIEDGSDDQTPGILARCASADSRVRVLHNRGSGLVDALNFGLAEARADLIARMDADDRSRPRRLAAEIAFLADNPRVVAVGTQVRHVTGDGTPAGRSAFPCASEDVRRLMARTCCVAHPTVLMRRQPVLDLGGYRKAFGYAEDYDLWLRLLDRGDIANLNMIGLDYRTHAAMATIRGAERQALEAVAARCLARYRMGGGAEPVIDPVPIDRQTLRNLGVDERTIARHVRKAWFGAARTLHRMGGPDARRKCLEQAGPLRLPDGGVADYADYAWRWLKVFV